jgi:hypothetical protein
MLAAHRIDPRLLRYDGRILKRDFPGRILPDQPRAGRRPNVIGGSSRKSFK